MGLSFREAGQPVRPFPVLGYSNEKRTSDGSPSHQVLFDVKRLFLSLNELRFKVMVDEFWSERA
jgi:hypothetical protein